MKLSKLKLSLIVALLCGGIHPSFGQAPAKEQEAKLIAVLKSAAEINAKAVELKDKPVLVRGKIVKYNPGIMGKNWLGNPPIKEYQPEVEFSRNLPRGGSLEEIAIYRQPDFGRSQAG
jgi:hypothetical protein